MATIEKIKIKGFRGVRDELELALPNSKSLLLYGDNGSGKSSILDAIEWFLTDAVSHLKGEEVETYGGLRHALIPETSETSVELVIANPGLSSIKKIVTAKDKLKSELTPQFTDIENASLKKIGQDKVWLRGIDLVSFVLGTKSDRLNDISSIIGFKTVSDTKATLKKASNDLRNLLKTKNFQSLIATEKETIAKNLNAVIGDETQFLAAANQLIGTIDSSISANNFTELEAAIKSLSASAPSEDVTKGVKLNQLAADAGSITTKFDTLKTSFDSYKIELSKYQIDSAKLAKLTESSLLESASKILNSHPTDDCPLCLQVIPRDDLKMQVTKRLEELKKIKEESEAILQKSKLLQRELSGINSSLNTLLSGTKTSLNEEIKKSNEAINAQLTGIANLVKGLEVSPDKQMLSEFDFDQLKKSVLEYKIAIEKEHTVLTKESTNPATAVVAKLSVANNSFERLKAFNAEFDLIKKQVDSLDKVTAEFIVQQKNGMESFLKCISQSMNEYYLFMNPNDKVDNIQLVCLNDKNGEFVGVAINYTFHQKPVDSARKYLSESHINALGLCLFLSTVRAFNKVAKVIVFDDVISSFDREHRTMFARLLDQKFSDLQILILTHENEWFDYLSSLVKGKNWSVLKTKWSANEGTSIDQHSNEIRERIVDKLTKNDESDLSNLIRRFSEKSLKEIAEALETPIPFRFNDKNESRAFEELFSYIRSNLNKKSQVVGSMTEVANLATTQFFGNKGSHDNPYNPSMADLKVAFEDLEKFRTIFKCAKCSRLVSTEFENSPEKKITCKCGQHSISWK